MSKYKEIWDNVEYSFSTLNQYCECPYSIYLKKIVQEEGISNAYAEIGSYGHSLNERIFKNEITVQEALEECIEEFGYQITEDISESNKEKKYNALCDYLAELDESYKDRYEVVAVELKVQWKIGRNNLVGYIDLILKDKETEKIFLIDHKSANHFLKKNGEPLSNQKKNFEEYKHQMYMYSDAMKKILGFYPDYIVWNHFLDNSEKTVIPFDENEYKETIEWVKSTIRKMKRDEKFKANKSFMMCKRLCDYRESCEYNLFDDLEEGE